MFLVSSLKPQQPLQLQQLPGPAKYAMVATAATGAQGGAVVRYMLHCALPYTLLAQRLLLDRQARSSRSLDNVRHLQRKVKIPHFAGRGIYGISPLKGC